MDDKDKKKTPNTNISQDELINDIRNEHKTVFETVSLSEKYPEVKSLFFNVITYKDGKFKNLEIEHKAKLMTLISKFVAEVDAREEEENKKRLERLKLINELTGNERAKELLDLEENFKKSTLILGSAFDTEEGAKIYEKSLMIFTEKKQEIN